MFQRTFVSAPATTKALLGIPAWYEQAHSAYRQQVGLGAQVTSPPFRTGRNLI